MVAAAKSLKLLFRLEVGDTIELAIKGFPAVLRSPRIRLVFLHYSRNSDSLKEALIPVSMDGRLLPGDSASRVVHATIRQGLLPGMYLLASVIFKARTLEGRIAVGSVGTSLVPIEPRLGFCIDNDLCNTNYLDREYDFLRLTLL
jgi:hypothetical protein